MNMAIRLNVRAFGRAAAGVGLALALAAGTTLLTGTAAHAQDVTTGSVAFTGDPGDYVSLGQSYSYSTAVQDRLTVGATDDHNSVSVSVVSGTRGDWWYLNFNAPKGSALTAGTYDGAIRTGPLDPNHPGMDIGGNGRDCGALTGTFTVSNVVFGPYGYVQAFDAAYEQHCSGAAPGLRGEIHIANPPAPAELTVGVAVAAKGTADPLNGKATVRGTVTCNEAALVTVYGGITQVAHRAMIRGTYYTTVDCTPGAPVAWSAQADPAATPFQKGDVEVTVEADAQDPYYPALATDTRTVTVTLRKG